MDCKKELTIEAALDNLDIVMGFLEEILEDCKCPKSTAVKIAVAFEEIFVNIANYAYDSNIGCCTIIVEASSRKVIITVKDKGVEFNPIEKDNPDVTLSVEDRKIGGLGIFMTKKIMDKISYVRNNDENILVMEKFW